MPEPRPNILLVLTDQQRADMLGDSAASVCGVTTPNIDRLARYGVRFDQAFCTAPICCPSRATLMTGLYPSQTNVYGNLGNPCAPLNERTTTIGHRMQALGYETAYHGKWHLGGDIHNYGFETAFDCSHDETTLQAACRHWRDRDWIIHRRPFFHVVSFLNPHDVYFYDPEEQAPAGQELLAPWPNQHDDLKDKPFPQRQAQRPNWPQSRWNNYRRWAGECLQIVDRQVGQLVRELINSGFGPNTWIILSADHGDTAGEHSIPFKGPWMYDGVTRVPLILVPPQTRFTGKGKGDAGGESFAARRTSDLVSLADIVPTVLDLAGAPADSTLPGHSLLPAASGQPVAHDQVISEWHQSGRLVSPIRMLRTARWKYNLYLGYGEELYDLQNDPHELTNLAAASAHAATKKDLRARLEAHIARTGDPFFSHTPTDIDGKPLVQGSRK